MRHLKIWENWRDIQDKKIHSLDDIWRMEKWIETVWNVLADYPETKVVEFFEYIENNFGEDIATIIDSVYSADKLHYHQNGKTVATGGIDTSEFINLFDTISSQINDYLDINK